MDTRSADNSGHRGRLRTRFLQSGLDGFLDYEIIELLLTLGTPRRDCKVMAREAIKMFGSLREVLDASLIDLQKVKGIGPSNAFGLKLSQAIAERISLEKVADRAVFTRTQVVADYLQKAIGSRNEENLIVLFLDTSGHLIEEKIISVGILNASLVHPREVFKNAIDLRASHVIVSHNHPSGSIEPSRDDRGITKQLAAAGEIVGITLHDHIIVTKTEYFSFKDELLL